MIRHVVRLQKEEWVWPLQHMYAEEVCPCEGRERMRRRLSEWPPSLQPAGIGQGLLASGGS